MKKPASRKRVLVVDDDPTIRDVLETMLSFEGCEVMTAPDGESSLEAASVFEPDVVLLDVMMPGMDGFEVCRRLRGVEKPPSIVMVTGKTSTADERAGYTAGADAYIRKPFSPIALMRIVEERGAPKTDGT